MWLHEGYTSYRPILNNYFVYFFFSVSDITPKTKEISLDIYDYEKTDRGKSQDFLFLLFLYFFFAKIIYFLVIIDFFYSICHNTLERV